MGFLKGRFPSSVSGEQMQGFCDSEEKLFANLKYLADLKLIDVVFAGTGYGMRIEAVEITGLGIAEAEGYRR